MVGVCEHCKSTYKYIGISIYINGSTGVRVRPTGNLLMDVERNGSVSKSDRELNKFRKSLGIRLCVVVVESLVKTRNRRGLTLAMRQQQHN